MAKALGDEKILSYNDVVLRGSDLGILSGPYFLNDRLIEFYFSYLGSCHSSEDILLVPPSIAFWIKECPDPASLKDFLEPLQLPQRKLIIFPINNNDDASIAEAGNHWSLLAFERSANSFVHHDSGNVNMNRSHAKRVYKMVLPYLSSNATYVECCTTPKQVNGYDCGMYVIAFARSICNWHMSTTSKDTEELWLAGLEQITPSIVSDLIYCDIEVLRFCSIDACNSRRNIISFCWSV